MGPFIATKRPINEPPPLSTGFRLVDRGNGITVDIPNHVQGPHEWHYDTNTRFTGRYGTDYHVLQCDCGWYLHSADGMNSNPDVSAEWRRHRDGGDDT